MQADTSVGGAGEISRLLDDWLNTLRARDVDSLMAYYAPGVVFFDGVAPLQLIGTEPYQKNWEEYFTWFPGPMQLRNARAEDPGGRGHRVRPLPVPHDQH